MYSPHPDALSLHELTPLCSPSLLRKEGELFANNKYIYVLSNYMGKNKYLDFKVIKKHARELRHITTDSEKLLWKQLRNRKLSEYKFLRQHPIVYKAGDPLPCVG